MRISYDKEVDAMYVYFKKGKIAKTLKVGGDFIIDIDSKKNIIGLEVLNASLHTKKDKEEKANIFIGSRSFPLCPAAR